MVKMYSTKYYTETEMYLTETTEVRCIKKKPKYISDI